MKIYYEKYLSKKILEAQRNAYAEGRVIEKIVLTKGEARQLEYEIGNTILGFKSTTIYGIPVEVEAC